MNYDRVKNLTAAVLCGSFVLGAAAGTALAASAGAGETARAAVGLFAAGGASPVRAWAGCLLPVTAAAAAGLTVYCRAVVPALFFARGLSVSYAAAAVSGAVGGGRGALAALAALGPKDLLLTAALLTLCLDAYAKTLAGRRAPEGELFYAPDAAFLVRSAAALALSAGAALCSILLSPRLAAGALF